MQELTKEQEELVGKGYNCPPFAQENTAHINAQVEFLALITAQHLLVMQLQHIRSFPSLLCYSWSFP